MENIFKIGGKEYILPTEISVDQYYFITDLFSQLKIDAVSIFKVKDNNTAVSVSVGKVLVDILKSRRLGYFFSLLLIPVVNDTEGYWDEKFKDDESNVKILGKIGDTTAFGVLKDFLSGRGDLMISVSEYLKNLMTQSENLKAGIGKEL